MPLAFNAFSAGAVVSLADQGKQYILRGSGRIHPLAGNRLHALAGISSPPQPRAALTIQRIGNPLNLTQHGVIEWYNLAIVTHLRTHIEDFLQCAFANQLMVFGIFCHYHRHPATLEIKRNLINFCQRLASERADSSSVPSSTAVSSRF